MDLARKHPCGFSIKAFQNKMGGEGHGTFAGGIYIVPSAPLLNNQTVFKLHPMSGKNIKTDAKTGFVLIAGTVLSFGKRGALPQDRSLR